jgi:hypothetical protein
MQTSKNVTTMAGRTTTKSHPYFAFFQTEQFQLLSLTYQSWFMTVRLRSMGIFMASWMMFSGQQGQSVALTQPLETCKGNSCTSCHRTYLVLWHRHIMRGNWSYEKKGRQHWRDRQLSGGCGCRPIILHTVEGYFWRAQQGQTQCV